MHWNGISKVYTPSVLKQSGLKCFRDALSCSFLPRTLLLHKAVLVSFNGDGIMRGNSAFCC